MLNIVTNNHEREVITWFDLSDKEKEEFDYIENPDENFRGFRYRGCVYDLGEFLITEGLPELKDWDGYMSELASAGTIVRYCREPGDIDFSDWVVAGYYYVTSDNLN